MGRLENDCIVLLSYVADNPDAPQDIRSLEEATGIPKSTVFKMIYYPWVCTKDDNFYYWAIEKYADKYGFDFKVMHGLDGKHLSVVRRNI